MKSYIALIPARGGSKSIPRKNLVGVAGIPLIAHTIKAALESQCFEAVVVSTDDVEIAEVAKEWGALVLDRPKNLATDEATSQSVVEHAIQNLSKMSTKPCHGIVLLQPTSPLRNADHIRESVSVFEKANAKSLIAVESIGCLPYKSFLLNQQGQLQTVLGREQPFMRRQDLPETYCANGAIYIVEVSEFLKQKSFLLDPCVPYVMSADLSIDIDEDADLKKIENLLRRTT